jgi:hypothetical protein
MVTVVLPIAHGYKLQAAITKESGGRDFNLIGKSVWAKLFNSWPTAIEARIKLTITKLY